MQLTIQAENYTILLNIKWSRRIRLIFRNQIDGNQGKKTMDGDLIGVVDIKWCDGTR